MIIDKQGYCRNITKSEAKSIVFKMLRRDRDLTSPDFDMFTTVQRRALYVLCGFKNIEQFYDEEAEQEDDS